MPDLLKVAEKKESVVSFASGSRFCYDFKAGTTATVDLVAIFKSEKGLAALKRHLGGASSDYSGAGVRVKSSVRQAKPMGSVKKLLTKTASKLISKIGITGNIKKSVSKVGKSVPKLRTPASSGSAANTPKQDLKNFSKMKQYL